MAEKQDERHGLSDLQNNSYNFLELKELRRQAYVDALMATRSGKTIVGYFGADVPELMIHQYGALAAPIMGLDGHVFQFDDENSTLDRYCDVIRSTLVYLQKDKCPLQHAAKAYVIGGSCSLMYEAINKATEKPVFYYSDNDHALAKWLVELLGSDQMTSQMNDISQIFSEISRRLNDLKKANISGYNLWLLNTYISYVLDPVKRIELLDEVTQSCELEPKFQERRSILAVCPAGIGEKIAKVEFNPDYQISPHLQEEYIADYGYEKCFFSAQCRFDYS
ncbi:MAG: hypothetical protein ACOYCB_04860 [Fastidiosipilaceae bacterium]|jgi:hypothetical protein|nr:hypothetical protein [Clostridiaceae bacterium]